MLGLHKTVKHTLKTLQQMLQDFQRVFGHFIENRYCRVKRIVKEDTLTEENHPFERMGNMTFDTHRRLFTMISPYKYAQHHSSENCLYLSEKNVF